MREVPSFRRFADPDIGLAMERSYVYFCPRCGSVWGGLYLVGGDWSTCLIRMCKRHGDGRLAAQSPADEPTGVKEDWPRAALVRELFIEIERLENGLC